MLSLSSAFGLLCNIYYTFYLIPFIPVYYLFVNLYLFDSFALCLSTPSLFARIRNKCVLLVFFKQFHV